MLAETIKNQIDKLLKELEQSKNQTSKEVITELQNFVDLVSSNVERIDSFDTDKYVSEVYKGKEEVLINMYKKNLNALKSIIELKKADESGLIELTPKQIEFIKQVCEDTKEFILRVQNENNKETQISDSINKYQNLASKLRNQEKISKSDVEIILEIISSYDKSEQIAILKEVISYNYGDTSKKKKTITIKVEDMINQLEEHKVENKEECKETIEEYKDEILENGDIENFKEILTYLEKNNLYDKFEITDNLFAILVYGTVDTVRAAHEDLENNKLMNASFIYKMPNLWTSQDNRRFINKSAKPKDRGIEAQATLKGKTIGLTRQEVYEIIEICKQQGTDYEKVCVFKKSPEVISFLFNEYKKYGIKIQPSMLCLDRNDSILKCDMAIECNMFNPKQNGEDITTYCNTYPTFINNILPGHALLIQSRLQSGMPMELIEQEIRSKRYNEVHLSHDFRFLKGPYSNLNSVKGQRTESEKRRRAYAAANQMTSISYDEELKDFEKMEAIINTDDYVRLETDDSIMNSKFITELDNKYGIQDKDYLYEINGVRISRYKVLRLYQAFKIYNLDNANDPAAQISEEDMRLFSIAYGTYFKEDIYKKLKEEIQAYFLGGVRS